ncbi:MAG: aminodeoxychorismate synthase component I [Alphaproteobacteria bacterium]|nr:aminodeoxychorismate synthase component I [Alphaproteobacteria bacterium]
MTPFIRELQGKNPLEVFSALRHLPYSLLLDSADLGHPTGHYSFVVSHPIETIESKDGITTLTNWNKQKKYEGDPFTIVQERLKHWIDNVETVRGLPPFQGGAAGYFGYDLGRSLEKIPDTAQKNALPDMAIGIYDQVMTFDHRKNQAWIITHAPNYHDARKKQDYLLGLVSTPSTVEKFAGTDIRWHSNIEKDDYIARVKKVINYIEAGDIFQTNLSQRFEAPLPEDFDAYAHYLHLREINPAPFAAFMNCGNITISSASPERFLSLRNRMVETRPIKGTRPRAPVPIDDAANREALEASEKDRAENTMIVDLLRSDLSKVCLPSTVEVPALCRLESFASVHHLVSIIRGKLKNGKTALDLLRACFPGGSITGAPKIRAMEIIEELEPARRGSYCGAMGYIGFDGTMDTSILIRTLVYESGTVSLQTGGGIVADSSPEREYEETLHKAAAIFRSFRPQERDRQETLRRA